MRLIDGDALKQEFEDLAAIQWNKDTCTTCARAFKESAERVEDAKTVDAVSVVRCKDCRHRDPEDHKCDSGEMERQGCPFKVADDYFCAYGER